MLGCSSDVLGWTLFLLGVLHSQCRGARSIRWHHVWPLDDSTCGWDAQTRQDALFPGMAHCRMQGASFQGKRSLRLDGGFSPFIDLHVNSSVRWNRGFKLAVNVRPKKSKGTLLEFSGTRRCITCIHGLTVELVAWDRLHLTVKAGIRCQSEELQLDGATFAAGNWTYLSLAVPNVIVWRELHVQVDADHHLVNMTPPRVLTHKLGIPGTLRLGARLGGGDVFKGDVSCAVLSGSGTSSPTKSEVIQKCRPSNLPSPPPTFSRVPLHVFPLSGKDAGTDVITNDFRQEGNSTLVIDDDETPLGYGSVYVTDALVSVAAVVPGVEDANFYDPFTLSLDLSGDAAFALGLYVHLRMGATGTLAFLQLLSNLATTSSTSSSSSSATTTVHVHTRASGAGATLTLTVENGSSGPQEATQSLPNGPDRWAFVVLQRNESGFSLWVQESSAVLEVPAPLDPVGSARVTLGNSPAGNSSFPGRFGCLALLEEVFSQPAQAADAFLDACLRPLRKSLSHRKRCGELPALNLSVPVLDSPRQAAPVSCMCRCKSSHQPAQLQRTEEAQAAASSETRKLAVLTSSTSAARRKLTSATDARRSATVAGAMGVGLLVLVGVLILGSDLSRIFMLVEQRRQHKSRDS